MVSHPTGAKEQRKKSGPANPLSSFFFCPVMKSPAKIESQTDENQMVAADFVHQKQCKPISAKYLKKFAPLDTDWYLDIT
ncbi:MAG: hypothetical protein MUD08_06135 [Cytophagales bacterium]|nr:hypothetical protein [Cytophagales bacterium]